MYCSVSNCVSSPKLSLVWCTCLPFCQSVLIPPWQQVLLVYSTVFVVPDAPDIFKACPSHAALCAADSSAEGQAASPATPEASAAGTTGEGAL